INPIEGISIVAQATLLGITFSERFGFDSHLTEVLSQCNRRSYLLKQLRNQGLPIRELTIVFEALVISKLMYAVCAWGGYLNEKQCSRINGFFKKMKKWQFCRPLYDFREMLMLADKKLFFKCVSESHC